MTDCNTLLNSILDNPDDDTARLVLADLLRESDFPEDQARGRFLWGGITAAAYHAEDLIDDRVFYTAQGELGAVAATGLPAQWLSALGIGPSPLTKRDWGWDCDRDRVTVRIGDSLGVFTRGMLAELSLSLGEWYAVADVATVAWPLETIRVTDVPGLTFAITKEPSGWRLVARLRVPGRRIPIAGMVIPGAVAPSAHLLDGPADWRVEEQFTNRAALVAGITAAASASLVADLREVAGDRWPSPPRRRR